MYIYFIRHGETDWNRIFRLQGRENIPLNEAGRNQAELTAQALAPVPIDYIAASPLQRAYETGQIIAARHPSLSLTYDFELIERDYGRLSGLTKPEREKFAATGEPDLVEPLDDLCQRTYATAQKYTQLPYNHILLVSHGAWINSLVRTLTHGQMGSNKTWLKNGGITIINEKMELLHYNLSPEEFMELNH